MFESVLLPAPFSPSSACTSPAAASKSTASFASTPGKCFVIPRIETAGETPGWPAPLAVDPVSGACCPNALARRLDVGDVSDHTLHEPLHRVERVDSRLRVRVEAGSLRDLHRPALVVDRAAELVPLPGLDQLLLRGDRRLRLGGDARAVRRELGETVVDRAVVEAGLPGAGEGFLDPLQVIEAPVVDRCGLPLLGRELLRVGVVADPRDPLLLGVGAGRGTVDVLAEHVGAGGDEGLRRSGLL